MSIAMKAMWFEELKAELLFCKCPSCQSQKSPDRFEYERLLASASRPRVEHEIDAFAPVIAILVCKLVVLDQRLTNPSDSRKARSSPRPAVAKTSRRTTARVDNAASPTPPAAADQHAFTRAEAAGDRARMGRREATGMVPLFKVRKDVCAREVGFRRDIRAKLRAPSHHFIADPEAATPAPTATIFPAHSSPTARVVVTPG